MKRWHHHSTQSTDDANAAIAVAFGGFLSLCGIIFLFYAVRMTHPAIAVIFTAAWVACNFYLWSLKQSQPILLLESLGMSLIAFPAIYWYVTRRN
jgi:hypothetical protein